MQYEVLFYNGWETPPTYYVIGFTEGETPEQALLVNLPDLIVQAREMLGPVLLDLDDEHIAENLCLARENGFVSTWEARRAAGMG